MGRLGQLRKFWNGLTGRMVLGVFCIHLLVVPLFYFGVLLIFERTYKIKFVDHVRSDASLYASLFSHSFEEEDTTSSIIIRLEEALLSGGINFADFVYPDGNVVLSTVVTHNLNLIFIEDFFFGDHNDDMYYIDIPVRDNVSGETLGSIRLGYDEKPTLDLIDLAYWRGSAITIAYVVFSLLLVLFFGKQLSKPILSLRNIARSVATGNHSVDMRVYTDILEIKHLADDLDRMRLSLVKQNREIADREMRLQTIMDNVVEGIIVFDEDGIVHSFNRAAEEMFYMNAEEVLGNSISILVSSSNEKILHEILNSDNNKREGTWYETQGIRKGGTQFPMEFAINEVLLENSKLFTALVRDITERKQTEEALRESEERFRGAFEYAAIGKVLVSREHKILEVNQALCEMLGYSEAELLSKSFTDITYKDDVSKSLDLHQKLFNGEIEKYNFDKRYVHKDGYPIWVQLNVSILHGKDDKLIHAIGQIQDITESRELSEELSYQAHHDELTGLVNRREFNNRLERVLKTIDKEETENALCYMDLDQFKVVNDTCGHIGGDELLKQLATLLQANIRQRDTLARLGGDEFGVLMERCSMERAEGVASNLHKAISDFRFIWEGKTFNIGVSIGLVPVNSASGSMTEILKQADTTCYAAKDAGRNRIHIYHDEDEELALRHGEMQWVSKINQALEDNRFHLVYQSIVPLENDVNEGEHYELLIRMTDEGNKVISPGSFLPAAERYNITPKLDRWVINTAFNWFANNPQHLNNLYQCSINISGLSLGNEDLQNFIIQQLDEYSIPANKICFEITETAAISKLTSATSFIKILREVGCKFALDDFGSGLSSFAYLKNLPVDYLKIDGVFVKDILDDPIDLAMVRSINEIGHVMGKKTIAKFIENREIFDKLKEIGVDYAQGFGVAMPKPIEEKDPL